MKLLALGRKYDKKRGELFILWSIDHMAPIYVDFKQVEKYVDAVETPQDVFRFKREFRNSIYNSPVIEPDELKFIETISNNDCLKLTLDERYTLSDAIIIICQKTFETEEQEEYLSSFKRALADFCIHRDRISPFFQFK